MKPSVKYGIITGIACLLWLIIAKQIGFTRVDKLRIIILLLIYAGGIAASVYFTKRDVFNNVILFKEAFKAALTVALFTALVSGISILFYATMIKTGYVNDFIEQKRAFLLTKGKSTVEIVKELKNINATAIIFAEITSVIFNTLLSGTILGVVVSLIFCKKD